MEARANNVIGEGLYDTRIRLHAEAAAYEEPVSIHRGTLPVATRDAWRLATRVEQPLQHSVHGAYDSIIGLGKTEVDKG